jgi:hypothetical protein
MRRLSPWFQHGSSARPWASERKCSSPNPDALREERHVDAPLVLAAAAGGYPVDHDLALAQRQVSAIDQAAREDLPEKPLVPGERGEQPQRRDSRRHRAVEPAPHLVAEGRVRRGHSCRHRLLPL